MYTHEIGDGDGSGISGVPGCVLVPRSSADDFSRIWRPARMRAFGYELTEGGAVGYGLSQSGGRWVSLGILMNTVSGKW